MKYSEVLAYARELRKNQTKAEAFFWSKVRNRKFNRLKFNRQFVLEYENSSYFIADFHCFEKKLIVEIDGEIHKYQKDYDQMRENILEQMGYKVIRFTNEEVLNQWVKVAQKIEKILTTLPQPLSSKERGVP